MKRVKDQVSNEVISIKRNVIKAENKKSSAMRTEWQRKEKEA